MGPQGIKDHTCILRLNMQEESQLVANKSISKISKATKADKTGKMERAPGEDTNFYRKVNKYELDNMTVDWNEYKKEKERQQAYNNKLQKEFIDE